MGPTRPSTLVVAGLAAAAVAWLLISSFYYGGAPDLPWLPAVTLAGLAVLEAYAAVNTRARIERRPGREPVDPLLVARFVVLAKASSLAGAIFAGFYAGLTGWLFVERTNAAVGDRPRRRRRAGRVARRWSPPRSGWSAPAGCRTQEDDEDRQPGDRESRPGQR